MQQPPKTQVIALAKTSCGVGRWLSESKLKIEWVMVINNEVLAITLFDSLRSKTVRINIFNNQIVETNYTGNSFKLCVRIDNDEFYFLKAEHNYDLAINRISFKNLPTNNDTAMDRRMAETLPKYPLFQRGKQGDAIIIQRTVPLNQRNPQPQVAQPQPISQPNSYKMLNDSMDGYNHRFLFLAIDENKEDPSIVQFVNNPI